ncbi:MAG: YggT family protein [Candidatus Eremiobacteraeota bacterium]|nr:YggT family protein [Candidatus Eremiobacteraeota bacterium]MBV8354002.1 YggT family protein [Candidatus Eremiobacteraeota bacterium]
MLQVYSLIMIVYAVASWLPSIRGRWTDYLAMLVEPVVNPVRRMIPPMGGLDLAFLIVLIVIQIVNSMIVRPNMMNACLFGM